MTLSKAPDIVFEKIAELVPNCDSICICNKSMLERRELYSLKCVIFIINCTHNSMWTSGLK